jgi:hypothetical protein
MHKVMTVLAIVVALDHLVLDGEVLIKQVQRLARR